MCLLILGRDRIKNYELRITKSVKTLMIWQTAYGIDLIRWTEKQVWKAIKNRTLFELQRFSLEWVCTISAFRTQVFREKRMQSWPFLLTFLRQGKKSKWVQKGETLILSLVCNEQTTLSFWTCEESV